MPTQGLFSRLRRLAALVKYSGAFLENWQWFHNRAIRAVRRLLRSMFLPIFPYGCSAHWWQRQ